MNKIFSQNTQVTEIIQLALREDIGRGDMTTESTIPPQLLGQAQLVAKAPGVICGLGVTQMVFHQLDSDLMVENLVPEGQLVEAGTPILKVSGRVRPILTGERTALNLIQRLSGVASKTRRLSQLIRSYPTRLVDTRKTTPGLRILEKYATSVGGALNHRLGLDDAVLIKDNHILAAGGIRQAVRLAREAIPFTMKIEVETESEREVCEALEAGAEIIMLDNMNPEMMAAMVQLIAGRALTEASGNIDEQSIVAVAQTGVDFISSGALTHSAVALDISLDLHM